MTQELSKRIVTCLFIGAILGGIFFFCPPLYSSLLLGGILATILLSEMPRLLNYKKLSAWVITIFYPCAPFGMLIELNQQPEYHWLVLFIFLVSFANDSGAYCAGKSFGKHRIWPAISPKKSWEGFLGGLVSIFFCMLIIAWQQKCVPQLPLFLLYSWRIATAATVGDFFESWLKRRVHIKDSGNVLPGHGGLLDRFDSILFVTVLVYAMKNKVIALFCL